LTWINIFNANVKFNGYRVFFNTNVTFIEFNGVAQLELMFRT